MSKVIVNLCVFTLFYTLSAQSDTIKYPYDIGKYVGDVIKENGKKIRHGNGVMSWYQYAYRRECGGKWDHDALRFALCKYPNLKDPNTTGRTYEGSFEGEAWEEYFHGYGVEKDVDGLIYEGNFSFGKYDGKGKLTKKEVTYEGDFVEGKKHGEGTYQWPDGSVFVGTVVNDVPHGKGTYTWSAGSYTGDVIKGKFTGLGIFTYPEEKYDGEALNGKYQGRGAYFFKDGSIYVGQWKEGKRSGYGIIRSAIGVIQKGTWLNGELTSYGEGTADLNRVNIGSEVWAVENLYEVTFNNGDKIAEAKSHEQWNKFSEQGVPAFIRLPKIKHGHLYNLHVILDPRGIAPDGWRLPTAADFENMCKNFPSKSECSRAIRASEGWDSSWNTNTTGMNVLAAGVIRNNGDYVKNREAGFWTNSIGESGIPGALILEFNSDPLRPSHQEIIDKLYSTFLHSTKTASAGYSIRLIKK